MTCKKTQKSCERAKRILPFIIKHIKKNKDPRITYKEFGEIPGVDIHFEHLGKPLGRILDQAMIDKSLPHVNSIIVNKKTKLASIYPKEEAKKHLEEVISFKGDWDEIEKKIMEGIDKEYSKWKK